VEIYMKLRVWLAGVVLAISWVAAGPSWAADFQIGAISIDAPWARGSLRERGTLSVYFTISNDGGPDRLIQATTSVAEEIEFRETVLQSDVIRALRLNGVNIPGGTHSFNPDSAFLLLLRARSVATGTVITVELTFELAGTLVIQVPVLDRRAIGPN
jgi:copper(I)-binding protein